MKNIKIINTPFSIDMRVLIMSLENELYNATSYKYEMLGVKDDELLCYEMSLYKVDYILVKTITDKKLVSLYKAITELKKYIILCG